MARNICFWHLADIGTSAPGDDRIPVPGVVPEGIPSDLFGPASSDSRRPAMIEYISISDSDLDKVRAALLRERYFYHGTTDSVVDSIRISGLDPNRENERSDYGVRSEPKAMRFCTLQHAELARDTAYTRAVDWDDRLGTLVQTSKPILLRTPATSLLSRSFGLDHSFSEMLRAAAALVMEKSHLSAAEFDGLISKYGAIACYQPIPANDLELLEGDPRDFCKKRNGAAWLWTPLKTRSSASD